ncbi:MAG: Dabb family protein [Tannerellaceae bacterium]|jgi:hypothetical protein|nr:Dabb family protein [Tannerellaceae bacterium]
MIRHIVMFKLKELASPEEKQAIMSEIKEGLELLVHRIDVVRSIHVGLNINPSESWDIVLTADFDSLEDLSVYVDHPLHVEISTNLIAPVKADRACVDFYLWN